MKICDSFIHNSSLCFNHTFNVVCSCPFDAQKHNNFNKFGPSSVTETRMSVISQTFMGFFLMTNYKYAHSSTRVTVYKSEIFQIFFHKYSRHFP